MEEIMKTLIIMGIMILISVVVQAQEKIKIDDSSRKVVAQQSSRSSETTMIPWTYVDKKGNEFPIYMSDNGSCFVYKTSKKKQERNINTTLEKKRQRKFAKNLV